MNYITPHKVLAHVDRLVAWQQGETPAPVTVEIDLTNTCSLGCVSCHFRHTHVAGPWAAQAVAKPTDYSDTGRLADTARFVALMPELKAAGVKGVVFSGGGEPTLHPQFDLILQAAHDAGLAIGVYTLGGHISEARGRQMREHCTFVVVSLDACDAQTYADEKSVPRDRFTQACDGIQRLSGGPCVVGVSFLLHAGNWRRTADMVLLGRSLGASYVTFRPTVNVSMDSPSVMLDDRGWVTEALPTLWELHAEPDVEVDPDRFVDYRDWSGHQYAACTAIRFVTQITPDGRAWVCPNRRGMVGSELGNVHAEGFAAIWARHPKQWTDFRDCRAMCRLHLTNRVLADVLTPQRHEAFV